MLFEFIDNIDSIRIKADNKDNVFAKNSMRILSSPLDDKVRIVTLEGLPLFEMYFNTDTFIPAQASKEDLITYLLSFFDSLGSGNGDMLKSTYDTDDSGVVDAAESIIGGFANSYYGVDAFENKGFYYNYATQANAGNDPNVYFGNNSFGVLGYYPLNFDDYLDKATYDSDFNGIVDAAESVSGTANPDDYYGTNSGNIKGFHSLPQFIADYLLSSPIEIGDALVISSNIYPPAITTTVNNYTPTGFATTSVMYISSTGNQSITGLQAGVDGRVVFVSNIGNDQIKLVNNSPLSLASNRFYLNIDVIMKPSNGVILLYSEVLQRWTVLNIS
jgi:hypothetical protein